MEAEAAPEFGPLVDPRWLAQHLDEPDLVVVDVRWYLDGRSGRAAYDEGHIPGAVFLDLDSDLSATPSADGGRHPLPEPADFAAAMIAAGIGDSTRVVAYDDTGGITAGRLWWMLDALGGDVAVLDGGIAAWEESLSSDEAVLDPAVFTANHWPSDRIMTKAEVLGALGSGLVILDARAEQRYAHGGEIDPRPGHVPGARSAPATDNVVDGRLASEVVLAERYTSLGAADKPTVAYCGSGVSACIDLLAMRRAGLPDGRLFVGSWSAWGGDESLPIEEGPDLG
jgi:thiosulfate/3-mercaptopyruvate sulfurtransferase